MFGLLVVGVLFVCVLFVYVNRGGWLLFVFVCAVGLLDLFV